MKRIVIVLLGLATCALLESGCASVPLTASTRSAEAEAIANSLEQPMPQPPQFPRGHFRSDSGTGAVVLALHDPEHFQVLMDSQLLDSETLTVEGTQVLFDSVECAGQAHKPALYSWKYPDPVLHFEPTVSDGCAERQEYLAGDFERIYLFIKFRPLQHTGAETY